MKYEKTELANSLFLYAVTDRSWLAEGETLAAQVEAAIRGGVTMVQLREKNTPFDEFLAIAKEVKQITDRAGVPLMINDRVDVMLASDADGVHIGKEDGSVSEVRRAIGAGKILGVSARSVEMAKQAELEGADYLGVGDMFGSSTKLNTSAMSVDRLSAICRAVSIPIVAIGGVKRDNICELKSSGASGVAVISAIFAQPDKERAARELAEICRGTFSENN